MNFYIILYIYFKHLQEWLSPSGRQESGFREAPLGETLKTHRTPLPGHVAPILVLAQLTNCPFQF
jgi:hypothetical protein